MTLTDINFHSVLKKKKIWHDEKILGNKSCYPTYEKPALMRDLSSVRCADVEVRTLSFYSVTTGNTEKGEFRIWPRQENKDYLCAASLDVQDLVLLVGSKWYLIISQGAIAAGWASKVWRGALSHCKRPSNYTGQSLPDLRCRDSERRQTDGKGVKKEVLLDAWNRCFLGEGWEGTISLEPFQLSTLDDPNIQWLRSHNWNIEIYNKPLFS